jgi:hypothetical protein
MGSSNAMCEYWQTVRNSPAVPSVGTGISPVFSTLSTAEPASPSGIRLTFTAGIKLAVVVTVGVGVDVVEVVVVVVDVVGVVVVDVVVVVGVLVWPLLRRANASALFGSSVPPPPHPDKASPTKSAVHKRNWKPFKIPPVRVLISILLECRDETIAYSLPYRQY